VETPETQTFQILKQVIKKKIIEPRLVEVSRKIYRVIRSFVESSSKPIYEWNVGRLVNENTVVFKKLGKWMLTIWVEDEKVFIKLCGKSLADEVLRVEKSIEKSKLSINGVDEEFDINDFERLMSTALVPAHKYPFDIPISLYDVVEKICGYVTI